MYQLPRPEHLASLEQVIEKDCPFSPLTASGLTTDQMKAALFCSDLELSSSYLQNMSIVVGRRGAGKTTFLQAAHHTSDYNIVVEIDKVRCLGQIVLAVHGMPMGGRFPEAIAELWDSVIFTIVLSCAAKKYNELRLCRDYLAKIGATGQMTADKVAWLIVDALRENQKGKTLGSIAELIRKLHSVNFEDAKQELLSELRLRRSQAIILIDSLESEGYILEDEDTKAAISGLLHWAGRLNAQRSPFVVNLAIPGEYYFEFTRLSANPIKDFARLTILRWQPKDLIRLCTTRLLTYQYFHDKKRYDAWSENRLATSGIYIESFSQFLPSQFTLRDGSTEPVLMHVLRHSQCLPRQVFIYFNAIFKQYLHDGVPSVGGTHRAMECSSTIVANEVIAAFRHRYPCLRQVVEMAVPYLDTTFHYGELDKSHTRYGKPIGLEGYEFERMLVDSGVIGKVVGQTEFYVLGEFQYNLDRPLTLSSRDELCLHPVFQVAYGASTRSLRRHVLPVGLTLPADA